MSKIIYKFGAGVACFILIMSVIFLCGCSSLVVGNVEVNSIEKTSSTQDKEIYTIYLNNGKFETIEIDKPKAEGQGSITIDDVYDKYVQIYGAIEYKDFLELYFANENSQLGVQDGQAPQSDFASVMDKCLYSSVKVFTEFYEGVEFYGENLTNIYTGSAVICKIDSDYTYFLTNYHVVYSENANADNGGNFARRIVAYLYGSEGYHEETSIEIDGYMQYSYGEYAIECDLVGASLANDVAVFRANTQDVRNINAEARAVTFADSYSVGESIVAVGNPGNEGLSVSRGIISVENENIMLNIGQSENMYREMRIDAALYPGSSGGGVFNAKGELVGLANAGDGVDQNVNYAIPLNVVKNTMQNILYYSSINSELKTGRLGVTVNMENQKLAYIESLGRSIIIGDIVVSEVSENSASMYSGIMVGDILRKFYVNNQVNELYQSFVLGDCLLNVREGDEIKFEIERDGQTFITNAYVMTNSDFRTLE